MFLHQSNNLILCSFSCLELSFVQVIRLCINLNLIPHKILCIYILPVECLEKTFRCLIHYRPIVGVGNKEFLFICEFIKFLNGKIIKVKWKSYNVFHICIWFYWFILLLYTIIMPKCYDSARKSSSKSPSSTLS